MSVFVHAQGIKTVHAGGGGGKKMAKFCPRTCRLTQIQMETLHSAVHDLFVNLHFRLLNCTFRSPWLGI